METLFLLAPGAGVNERAVFIDRVELVSCTVVLDRIETGTISAIAGSPNTTNITTILSDMRAVYIVDGQTVTLRNGQVNLLEWFDDVQYIVGSGATISGTTITPAFGASSCTISVSFGGKTSNTATVGIVAPFLTLETFLPGTISGGFNDTGALLPGDIRDGYFWWGGRNDDIGNNIFALMISEWPNTNGDVYIGKTGRSWDLTVYNAISFDLNIRRGSDAPNGNASFTGPNNNAARMRLDIQTGGSTWHTGPVHTTANYLSWEAKSVAKSAFSGAPDWANVTGWRIAEIASPGTPGNQAQGGTTYYIRDFRATQ
jgi:hypothetical protein